MIYGIGIDMIELSRIEKILERNEIRFLDKILSDVERENCPINKNRRIEFVAGRFAGKEAFAKALGTGIGTQIRWRDIEILNCNSGKPFINIRNNLGAEKFVYHISISHTKALVVAKVIIEHR